MSIQSEKFALARAKNKQKEAKIEGLHNRLRRMSQDPKFTNEDREEIARQLRKLDSGKLDLGKLQKKPKKKNKGGLMVTPKRAKRGY